MINNKFSSYIGGKWLKIAKISRDTGLSRTTLSRLYYRKTQMIDFKTLDTLCNYLNCNISDILEFKKD